MIQTMLVGFLRLGPNTKHNARGWVNRRRKEAGLLSTSTVYITFIMKDPVVQFISLSFLYLIETGYKVTIVQILSYCTEIQPWT
jgi:hypothetical protein